LPLRYRASVVDVLISGHFLDALDARRKARSPGLRDDAPLRVAMLCPAQLQRRLSGYLHHHGSHKQSARMLHLHTNTVAYRLARIEAITGLGLGDPDDRLVAHVAAKIVESQGTVGTGSSYEC
jgi:DNA-binding PucR family transcriptional regulator